MLQTMKNTTVDFTNCQLSNFMKLKDMLCYISSAKTIKELDKFVLKIKDLHGHTKILSSSANSTQSLYDTFY